MLNSVPHAAAEAPGQHPRLGSSSTDSPLAAPPRSALLTEGSTDAATCGDDLVGGEEEG